MTTMEAVDAGLLVPGALAVVRNRVGVISQVTRSGQTADGVLHMVTVLFADRDGERSETVVWEREPGARAWGR